MKKEFSLLVVFIFFFVCCSNENKFSVPESAKEKKEQNLAVKSDSLTIQQLEKIKSFHSILNEVCESSLEEMINDFEKDSNADVEIDSWTRIASVYKKCINTWHYKPKLEMKKEIFQLILNRSMTTDEEAIKSVKPNLLSEKEIQVVLTFYNAEPDPFDELGK